MEATLEFPLNYEFINLDADAEKSKQQVLPGEIKGAKTFILTLRKGDQIEITSPITSQTIIFMISGDVSATSEGRCFNLIKESLFAAKPAEPSTLTAVTNCRILKICMKLYPEESENLNHDLYPFIQHYANTEKYRDYFKSEKTVSRTLVHPFTLPRFCMGSVETTGIDRIEPHAHAMLDQLFYSFEENSCDLLIDNMVHRYEGNCLLHIPLGSNHGVQAHEGDVVKYFWIDFFESSEAMQYLVEVHKPV